MARNTNWDKSYESYTRQYLELENKGIQMKTPMLTNEQYKFVYGEVKNYPPKYSKNRYNSFKKNLPRYIAQEQREYSSAQVDRLRKAIKGGQSFLRSEKIASGVGISEAEEAFLDIKTGSTFLNQNYADLWAVIQVVFPQEEEALYYYYHGD